MSKIKYIFIRHGFGCHNALSPFFRNNEVQSDQRAFISKHDALKDPLLAPMGVDASIQNGCVVSKVVKNIHITTEDPDLEIKDINVVACSPLLRSMETAYYMTRRWKNPPNKIYVVPYLREIDERSNNKYSEKSLKVIDLEPSYLMKPIEVQKEHLRKEGILDYFDFRFVEDQAVRKTPGDIKMFMSWMSDTLVKINNINIPVVNVFAITHAGVLREFTGEGYINNSGCIVVTNVDYASDNIKIEKMLSLTKYLPNTFFQDYRRTKYNTREYYCPSDRCGVLCSVVKEKRKQIDKTCNPNT
jgi:broad specificity phosphatase PhoE